MGRRGPPPKPAALKKAQGTFRKSREKARDGVAMPAGAPPCPASLKGAARAVWEEVVPALIELGTLSKVDGGVLESYCRSLAQARKLDDVSKSEPVVDTPFGPKINPAIPVLVKLWPVVERLAFALGLHYRFLVAEMQLRKRGLGR
jgi:P27 family predicted phage terminase small subunit